ncbi:sn-glycerol-3-phosphate import ATP-binding protein UgpC [Pseudochrobactrum sp. HB0163]|uniref:sn-glycerol-3-phosphate import ATP-binding protein UgpC n=1 Tax=Pseudochrobactrum sp. HB0163 TaxID=3450708 RepID=UPI003F6E0D4F
MAQVKIENVSKIYAGGTKAVNNVNIDIKDGEFIVLVGPSGCGKSTLLRMVAGLETISEGTVNIGGRAVNNMEPADRDIAMVFQNYALYPHMSVYDNMAYGLRNRKTPKEEIETRVAEAARMLELQPYLQRKPRALSGGQRQRVAMGRAIVRKPAVFLFDEPLSNLDAKLRVSMRGEIRHLQHRLGTTSIYVTHDQLEAMTLADRLVVLNGGQIEQIGAPLEIYHQPASTFVAGFIGSPAMNLCDATLHQTQLMLGADVLQLHDLLPVQGEITIGIRAEDLHQIAADEHTQEPVLQLRTDYVEELGAQRIVHGYAGNQKLVVALPPQAQIHEQMRLTVAREKLHFFNKPSGKRIEVSQTAATSIKTAQAVSA